MKKKLIILIILGIFLFASRSEVLAQWVSPGKLAKAHTQLEGIDNCLKCHSLIEGVSEAACKECHKKLIGRIKDKKGYHARIKGKCYECHTDHKGVEYDIIWTDKRKFDHNLTGYELVDNHRVECDKCHKKEKTYLGLSTECLGCHKDPHKTSKSGECAACHDFKGWDKVLFDHTWKTSYKLTGKHSGVKCSLCHSEYAAVKKRGKEKISEIIKLKPLKYEKCSDCHNDIHKGDLKQKECKGCHVTKNWEEISFNHNDPNASDYKISGKHRKVTCALCHQEEKVIYRKGERDVEFLTMKLKPVKYSACNDCHFDVHENKLKNQECIACHVIENPWNTYVFDHSYEMYGGYKLTGQHKDIKCDKCHEPDEIRYTEFNKQKKVVISKFDSTKSDCSNCHFDIHGGEFEKKKCDSCHLIEDPWKKFIFKHENEQYKGYKIIGKHMKIACEKCHERKEIRYAEFNRLKKSFIGKFKLNASECSDCHKNKHEGKYKEINTVSDLTCESCHSIDRDWKERLYEHKAKSNYFKYAPDGTSIEKKCGACHMCNTKVFCLVCCMENMNIPMY